MRQKETESRNKSMGDVNYPEYKQLLVCSTESDQFMNIKEFEKKIGGFWKAINLGVVPFD